MVSDMLEDGVSNRNLYRPVICDLHLLSFFINYKPWRPNICLMVLFFSLKVKCDSLKSNNNFLFFFFLNKALKGKEQDWYSTLGFLYTEIWAIFLTEQEFLFPNPGHSQTDLKRGIPAD